MTYKVTVTWFPTTAQSAVEQLAETIGGRFDLEKSYVQTEMFKDTPYYSEAPDGTLGDTPVNDNENTMHKGVLLPFKQAFENDEHSIVLTGIKRLTALYFEELSYVMGEQGFIITVEEEADHPVEVNEFSFEILDSYAKYGKEGVDWFAVTIAPGEDYHFVRISKDYLPTTSEELTIKQTKEYKSGESSSSISATEVTTMNEEQTAFYYDELGLFGVIVSSGADVDMGGIDLHFPTGGTWAMFETFSEYEDVEEITLQNHVETLKSISVDTEQTKLAYLQHQTLYNSDIYVEATYVSLDGSERTERIYDFSSNPQTGTTLNTAGYTDVEITYQDKSASYQIYVCAVTSTLPITWNGVPKEGFTELTEEPVDWQTSWKQYYESDGQSGYKPIEQKPVKWAPGTYYDANGGVIVPVEGPQLYRYYLVADGAVPDSIYLNQYASAISVTFGGTEFENVSNPTVTSYNPPNYCASYSIRQGATITYSDVAVICVSAPNTTVNVLGTTTAVFEKPGTYFLQYRDVNDNYNTKYVSSLKQYKGAVTNIDYSDDLKRSGMGCGQVGTKSYLFGGMYITYERTDAIQVFDSETSQTTTLGATLPTSAYLMACAVVGTKCYLFGGDAGPNNVFLDTISIYDTENDSIETLQNVHLDAGTRSIGCGVVGTNIYLFGGETASGLLDTISVFDTTNNSITTLQNTKLPQNLKEISVAAIGNYCYLAGGQNATGSIDTIYKFDTTNNTISSGYSLPQSVTNAACGVVGNRIYLFGGQYRDITYNYNTTLKTVMVVDTTSGYIYGTRSIYPLLPNNRQYIACGVVGTDCYLFGGDDIHNGDVVVVKYATRSNV